MIWQLLGKYLAILAITWQKRKVRRKRRMKGAVKAQKVLPKNQWKYQRDKITHSIKGQICGSIYKTS